MVHFLHKRRSSMIILVKLVIKYTVRDGWGEKTIVKCYVCYVCNCSSNIIVPPESARPSQYASIKKFEFHLVSLCMYQYSLLSEDAK